MTLGNFQSEVAAWGRKTFPNSTVDSISSHLAEEVIELLGTERLERAIRLAREREDIYDNEAHLLPSENPAEETADCLLLMLHLADRLNFSLSEAAIIKFAAVQKRKWDDGAERGYSKRVE